MVIVHFLNYLCVGIYLLPLTTLNRYPPTPQSKFHFYCSIWKCILSDIGYPWQPSHFWTFFMIYRQLFWENSISSLSKCRDYRIREIFRAHWSKLWLAKKSRATDFKLYFCNSYIISRVLFHDAMKVDISTLNETFKAPLWTFILID